MTDVPAGFEPIFRLSEFTELIGPLYSCQDDGGFRMGLYFGDKHANARGKGHGGMISTLADLAMGYALAFSETPPRPFVTVNLNVDFLSAIELGEWVEVHVNIDRKGRSLAFARCELQAGDRLLGRASGVFKNSGEALEPYRGEQHD
ncbi:MAG: PaaI family thioesterase [Salinisphaeraceae bacterium]|nr:PaaI family thioesterase [Salinisphaeraceae bacterium]